MTKRVLNVGQCALDHSNISELLNKNFDVTIETASTHNAAISLASQNSYDLILVNRLYDADGSSGQATIAQLCRNSEQAGDTSEATTSPVMLVSNYDDAQQAAQNAGAVSGFGKSQLRDSSTIEALATYLR